MSSPAVSAAEPAAPEPSTEPVATEALPDNPADWVDLPEDLMVEIEDPSTKQAVKLSLKDLKAGYRHAKASDQKFTAADQKYKEAQKMAEEINKALVSAKSDPNTIIQWVARETKRDPLDVLVEQIEKAEDPKVVDKLAGLLEKKLQALEAESKKSPELKELEQIRKERDELRQAVEAEKDLKVERQLFDSTKATLEKAGLQPSPLNAIQVIELMVEAKSMQPPIDLSPEEAALLLKEQIRSNAELLFKPTQPAAPVQAKASGANGATPAAAVDAAKREMKRESPRVTVIRNKKKMPEAEESEPKSFLESMMEHAYRRK